MNHKRQTGVRQYRVVVRNMDDSVGILTDWWPYSLCKKYIIERWRCWPPFACISVCGLEKLQRRFEQ